ncbi:gluconate 5-dehydrogenase [Rhodonellum psychrophilum GCM71 = DSM 17998]|uniref:Gluconate 5-dehydrogenase n=2 Tax=Rhodonellum TaxID=336827 RepID=U5C1G3_9BACT|nr:MULTISPECIES: gluconate 5-dehydrogenase [Rhodonellum]ERM82766.1 gluconate 5-dehydrogenase [Rhodonellum psychrophilum GCM71 = DSM 17998]MDO9554480.1 gluconate 5-dehydrogenase [Rhodonellum sp.]SDZ28437.1 gluconate 5-dehydrogenase [Rhodonellum ikkaensis]
MKNLFDLSGKVALVTGATHGLGMAMAKALALQGATLVINGHTPSKMELALQEYAKEGIFPKPYLFDVSDVAQVAENISKIETEVGPIDILVNNAGIIKRVPALEMDPEDFRKVIDMDLVSPFIVSQRVAKTMVERGGGKIINICSMMSELGRDTLSAYASAKGGLKMLTRNLATEWAKYNIQVNGIGPGYFATEQTAPLRVPGNALNEFIISRTPAGKWGDPEDLAGAVIFLSSKSSDFVNGQILYVDGGILATIGKPRD